MNQETNEMSSGRPRRRRYLIDHELQLLPAVLLLLMQGLILGVAVAVLYQEVSAVLEAQLYRIHVYNPLPVIEIVAPPLLKVLAGVVIAECTVVLIAESLWCRHVSMVIAHLRNALDRIGSLNFGAARVSRTTHDLHERIEDWRLSLQSRHLALAELLKLLDDPDQREMAVAAIVRLLKAPV